MFFIPFTMSAGAVFLRAAFEGVFDIKPTIMEFFTGKARVEGRAVFHALFRTVIIFPTWFKITCFDNKYLICFYGSLIYVIIHVIKKIVFKIFSFYFEHLLKFLIMFEFFTINTLIKII